MALTHSLEHAVGMDCCDVALYANIARLTVFNFFFFFTSKPFNFICTVASVAAEACVVSRTLCKNDYDMINDY